MDIFQVLKHEHTELRRLMNSVEDTTERAVKTREELFIELRTELLTHAEAEEHALYERLVKVEALHDLILEAREEHKLAETLLAEFSEVAVSDERWGAKMEVMCESVEHHLDEEEEKMFPKAKKELSEEEAELAGEAFLKEKARLLKLR